MRYLLTTLIFIFGLWSFTFGQTWQQLGGSFPTNTVPPVLKNLSNGTPVVVFANTSNNLSIALFDAVNLTWDFRTFTGINTVQNLSADVVGDKIFFGCKSTSTNYGVYYFDVTADQLFTVTTSAPTYFNNNVAISVGSFSPLRIAYAYQSNAAGALGCAEWGAGGWEFIGDNSTDIYPGTNAYEKLKVNTDGNFIHVTSNFDEDMDFPVRVFRKAWGNTGSFLQPTGSPIDIDGANLFDVANSKVDQGFQPTYNYTAGNVTIYNLLQTRKHQTTNSLTTNQSDHDAFFDILDLASAGDDAVNYVFYTDNSQNSAPNRVIKSINSGSWLSVGTPIQNGLISEIDISMNDATDKPFVGYRLSGNYIVKSFNLAPNYEDEGIPQNICANSGQSLVLDYLLFLDADGDDLVVSGITSSDPAVISAANIVVNKTGFNAAAGENIFEVEATPSPGGSGIVTITISVTDGIETAFHSFDVTVHPLPAIDAGATWTICEGNSVTLSGSGAGVGGTYTWDGGVTDGVPFFPASGSYTYSVTGTDANGCLNSDVTEVIVNPNPSLTWTTTAGNPPVICAGDELTMSASGAISYTWDNGLGAGDTKIVFPTVNTNYEFTGTDVNGCTSTQVISVFVNPLPNVEAGNNVDICEGAGVTLTGTGAGTGATYMWDNGVNDGTEFFPVSSGTYTVTGTDVNGCSNTDFMTLTVNTLPTISAGTAPTICEGDGVTLTASGAGAGGTYTWTNGISNGVEFFPTATDNYSVTGTDINGCVNTDILTVVVNQTPVIEAGSNETICQGEGVTLSGSGGDGATVYTWDNGVTDGVEFFPGTSGTYIVTGTAGNGCSSTDFVEVTVNPLPPVEAGNNLTVCEGTGVTLFGSGAGAGATYTWDNGVNDGTEFFPVSSGTYTVTGTDVNGCSNTDIVDVVVTTSYNEVDEITICSGDTYIFGTQTLTTPGTFTEVFTSAQGCDSTVVLTLNVNPTYNEVDEATICDGDTYIFGTQTLTTAGTFTETFTAATGCDSTVVLTLNVVPTYNEVDQVSICAGSSYQFGAQTLTTPGVYNETFTSVGGCDSTVVLTLTVVSPDFNLPMSSICSNGNAIQLMNFVTPIGGTFSGQGVVNNKFFPNQVAPNNTYTITYTRYFSALGCSATATQNITVRPTPQIVVNVTAATCGQNDGSASASFTSVGSNGLHNIYWSNGISQTGVTTSTNTNLAAGLYFINATNEFGCSATAPATIASSTITISGTTTPVSCFNGADGAINLTISSSSGIASINWSNGATTEDLSGLTAGPYEVTVVDNNGCTSTATFTISGPTEITWTTSLTPSTCGNADGIATVSPQGGTGTYSFQWFNSQGASLGSTTDTQTGLVAGNYLCSITDANGCSKVVSIVISDAGSPVIELNDVTNASCANDGAIDIDIISAAGIQSITWSNGETTEDISGLAPDNYSVYVMDENGCAGMLSVDIEPVLPNVQPICLVTVDTLTTTNKLVWERVQTTGIDAYKIYRETSQANVYQLVHTQAYADESEWTDTIASPMVRSWRYMISAVDDCGNESEMSPVHKTIHLSINAGIGSDVNLAWDSYEGFAYSQFNIWRHMDATGWIQLTSLPSNLFSYTDLGVLSIPGLDYIIEVEPADLCTSEKAQDYNSSRSNKARGEFNPDGGGNVGIEEYMLELVEVYPNPTSDELNIVLNSSNSNGVLGEIIDAQGKSIRQFALQNGLTTVNVNDLEKGMYFIQLPEQTGNNVLKFVKN